MSAQFEEQPESLGFAKRCPNDLGMSVKRGALIANPHLDTRSLLPDDHCSYSSSREGAAGLRDAIAVFLEG